MGTPGGFAAFLDDRVNTQLKRILNQWAVFLSSPDSRYVLSNDRRSGWFGRDAMAAMPNFVQQFECNPYQPYYGFTSWDNFFTRQFRDGQRPIAWQYYSETPSVGFDPAAPNDSQGYITEVAARAILLIQADAPRIGLMCFMAVGMAEVSTCDVTVAVGQHVNKGEQLGMFHFGGSTHCLIFRPGVNIVFNMHGQRPGLESNNIKINAAIGTVR